MYRTPSPNAPSNTNFTDIASGAVILSGQRSPKYLPTYENYQPISPRRSPNKFIFDAVSPRLDSNGKVFFVCCCCFTSPFCRQNNSIDFNKILVILVYHYYY